MPFFPLIYSLPRAPPPLHLLLSEDGQETLRNHLSTVLGHLGPRAAVLFALTQLEDLAHFLMCNSLPIGSPLAILALQLPESWKKSISCPLPSHEPLKYDELQQALW